VRKPDRKASARTLIVAAALVAALLGGAVSAGASSGQRFVTGTKLYPEPKNPRPAKGQVVRDSVFSTRVVRITDRARDGYPDTGIQNEYARSDPENRNGTLLVLRGNEASWQLYNARSFKRLRELKIGRGGQEAEPRWDSRQANVLYHLSGMRLMTLNVRSGRGKTVHDFKRQFPAGAYITTGSEGDASLDRRWWCLAVADSDFVFKTIVVYDRTRNRIVASKTSIESPVNYVSMDMSGRHCVVGYDNGDARVFSRDFSKEVELPSEAVGHSDLARTASGRDVLVYQNAATDWITMADLDTGRETRLLHIPFVTNTDIGLHFSGNTRVKGWILVSTYGSKKPPSGRRRSWMDRQLFMLELRPHPRVWRIAYTHTLQSPALSGEANYFAEAFAAIDTRGTRIYWGSNWGRRDLRRIDTHAALLPAKWWTRLNSTSES
jgi:hypothetical protein